MHTQPTAVAFQNDNRGGAPARGRKVFYRDADKVRFIPALAALLSIAIAGAAMARANSTPSYRFDLGNQSLSQALRDYGQISGQEIIFTEDLVTGRNAPTVKGSYTAEAALEQLLKGTGLTSERSPSGALMIRRLQPHTASAGGHLSLGTGQERSLMNGGRKGFGFMRLAQSNQASQVDSSNQATPGKTSPYDYKGESSDESHDQQPTDAANATQEVKITGTRIKSTISTTANPITVISAEDIQKMRATSVEDIVRRIPELDNNRGGISSNTSNTSQGSVTIGLRNLGSFRTLVLIDGRRSVGSLDGRSVDLDTIPSSVIERIEILKSGASSVYGADGIGGVINVITRKNFAGLEFNGTAGGSDRGDGDTFSLDVTAGTNFDRGNMVFYAGYSDRDPVQQRKRPWASDQFVGTASQGLGPRSSRVLGLLANLPAGQAYFYGPANEFVIVQPTGGTPTDALAAQGLEAPRGTFFLPGAGYAFNLSTNSFLIAGLETKDVGLNVRYGLTDNVRFTSSASYVKKLSGSRLNSWPVSPASSTSSYPGFYIPAFLEDYTWNSNTGVLTRTVVGGPNPGNPFGVTLQAITRLSTPLRILSIDSDTLRFNSALEGQVMDRFDWEAGLVYGQSNSETIQTNQINTRHLAQLAGQTPCGSDAAIGCSVANFLGVNTLTPQQLDYLTYDLITRQEVIQQYAYAGITGSLLELPAGDLALAIGAEARKEELAQRPSDISLAGQAFLNSAATRGDYTVNSFYSELRIPLLKDAPLANSLSVDLSARYDEYNSFGSATTWKIGLDYAVIDDLRLRGSYSTAFRAPGVSELFGGTFKDDFAGSDPCSNDGGAFAGSPQCVADLTARGADPSTYISSLNAIPVTSGGNADLQPEDAKNWTVGLVLTPPGLPAFTASVDYYNIKLDEAINAFTGESILQACYGPQNLRCDQVARGLTGDISNVDSFPINAGSEEISGVDVAAQYGWDLGSARGHLDLSTVVSYLISHEVQSATGGVQERAGRFILSEGGIEPKWKAIANLAWSAANYRVGWTTRYMSSATNADGSPARPGNFSETYWIHELSLGWEPGDYRINLGVDNIFDVDPPFLADGGTNSLPTGGYDFVGRYGYVKVSKRF